VITSKLRKLAGTPEERRKKETERKPDKIFERRERKSESSR